MSQRGSFVTQYTWCDKCFEVLKQHLCTRDKHLNGITIPTWKGCSQPEDLCIIAGKVGGLGNGDEWVLFDVELRSEIEPNLCHEVTIVVIDDDAQVHVIAYHPRNPISVPPREHNVEVHT